MTQCSRRPNGLPACLFFLGFMAIHVPSVRAQEQRYRVVRQEAFRQEAGAKGRALATIVTGAELSGGAGANGWVPVSLDGWIWSGSVGRANRDGHNLAVTGSRGENLRTGPNGSVIARLVPG